MNELVVNVRRQTNAVRQDAAADQLDLAATMDELANSALNLVPELKDEDTLDAIREDLDDELELVEQAMNRILLPSETESRIRAVTEELHSHLEAGEGESDIATEVILDWVLKLRAEASALIEATDATHSPVFPAARRSAADHQTAMTAVILGQEVDIQATNRQLVLTLSRASRNESRVTLDPEVDLRWPVDAAVTPDQYDQLGDIIVTMSKATAAETRANVETPSWARAAVLAIIEMLVCSVLGLQLHLARGVRRRRIAHLRYAAEHDLLTGLANRNQLEAQARRIREVGSGTVGLIFVDLDGFKAVNDLYGHPVGDAVLRLVAERLVAVCRPDDVVARVGGDEFAILLPETDGSALLKSIGQRLVSELARPFVVREAAISIGASAGVTMTSTSELDLPTQIVDADQALLAAKRLGKGQLVESTSIWDR